MASPAEEAAAEVDGEGGCSEAAQAFQQAALQQMRRELRQHEQAVQERLRQLDERLRALEERASGSGLPVTVGEVAQEASATAITDGQAQQEPVSPGVAERLSKLEAAVATALHTMFPRVEALLSQLERDSVGRACDGEDVADPAPAPARPAVAALDPAAQLLGRQLLEAMQDGTPERVRELLDAGADPNFRRGDGWTPLMMGARYNRNQVLIAVGVSRRC
ncbi:Protein of unknown function [Gryllus bimaculatus]|nr:Protein of unknown function [Gryllus bimaculatus]